MIKKLFTLLLFFPLFLRAQTPKNYSSSDILLELNKWKTCGSVLYIAAHPDDENTRLISYLENERHVRTGYLSLTRGDGGQNLIGKEQGVELGLIRSQELLAARRVDGSEQFFTRAYDFGYSKTPEETFNNWNKDSILSDVVWVIRKFKPDVIITRFSSNGSGGHGHHTASAILAEEAFAAAADPNRFKWQLKYVEPWKTQRLFYNSIARFRDPNADMSGSMKIDVGGYNKLLGKSYGEQSAESRSMHKSQGFGSAHQRGEKFEYFDLIKGEGKDLTDFFIGMDFSWNRYENGAEVAHMIQEAITKYDINKPNAIAPILTKIKNYFDQKNLKTIHLKKLQDLELIRMACEGLFIDFTSSEYNMAHNTDQKIDVFMLNRSDKNILISSIKLPGCYKGLNSADLFDTIVNMTLLPNIEQTFSLNVSPQFSNNEQDISQPYWLLSMPNGVFNIKDKLKIGLPEEGFHTTINVQGQYGKNESFKYDFPLQHRWVEPDKGELYRPLVITPPISISFVDEVILFNNKQSKSIQVKLKALQGNVEGNFELDIPKGWKCDPQRKEFSIKEKNQELVLNFIITPPNANGEGSIIGKAMINGKTYSKGLREIKYDHIPVQTWFPDASAKVVHLNVSRKKTKIGYIPGAGDKVAECLSQLGYEVNILNEDDINNGNLNVYECIITGIRAFNTNDQLILKKQKLLDFVAQGGNLIIQYNTNSWAGPLKETIGPKPFNITRNRVTDELATPTFLLPNHKVLNEPNKITMADFDGWIQERGIYFGGDIDEAYECPLSFHDKGEEDNPGSLLILKHGKGHYVYTGLVFFRELPAGVPGAYRLMNNLIEL